MGVSALFSDIFNVSPMRYAIMFSFDNIYGVFRSDGSIDSLDSRKYDLILYDFHNSNSPKNVLTDLCFLLFSEKIDLCIDDIVAIRINGKLYCYRFTKIIKSSLCLDVFDCFVLVPTFLFDEINGYLNRIHDDYNVLSVLDGRILSLDRIRDLQCYCIVTETSSISCGNLSFCFSLFCLSGLKIRNINPGGKPFVFLSDALYYFKKIQNKSYKPVLLFNRFELEMVKDYCELMDASMSLIG